MAQILYNKITNAVKIPVNKLQIQTRANLPKLCAKECFIAVNTFLIDYSPTKPESQHNIICFWLFASILAQQRVFVV